MENGAIADGQITASSFYSYHHAPQAGRLRYKHLSQPRIAGWVAYHGDLNPWLQIDLGLQYIVTRVATQGRRAYPQWVTRYSLNYSDDGSIFQSYVDQQGQRKVKKSSIHEIDPCSHTHLQEIMNKISEQEVNSLRGKK